MHPLNKKVKFMKDSIDFGSMEIPKLFRKLLIPTVLGMVFSAVFVITDGIFVGQGIGSDALAAVNITAPLFLISTGIGLMFGVGASVGSIAVKFTSTSPTSCKSSEQDCMPTTIMASIINICMLCSKFFIVLSC